jgi:small subunit ribosomal protein S21
LQKHYRQDGFLNKRGMTVYVNNNNINGAISLLKKRINEEGLKKELRDREHFQTKQQKFRKARAAAARRRQKDESERKRQDMAGGSL